MRIKMIEHIDGVFGLHTADTSYVFAVLPTGQLEHLYYGKKIRLNKGAAAALREKHAFAPGNTVIYDNEHPQYSLEDVKLEMSSYGKGDIREPFVEIVYPDGSVSSDFIYKGYELIEGKPELDTLPSSYCAEEQNGEVMTLKVTLADSHYPLELQLFYHVYEKENVISRSSKLINNGDENVEVKRLMSLMLDMDGAGYTMSTFNGAWAREMNRHDTVVTAGKLVSASYTGTSSSRANPFVMLTAAGTSEAAGDCYGFNLIYSGNHYEALEVNSFGKSRFVGGINPQSFSWRLEHGETFEAPEAVMTYSKDGCNGMSHNMHAFVREHIVRGEWKHKDRPVLLNSWEAAYFDINERKLCELAKAGKAAGVELFVMDDGWFGERNDDRHSLGDWEVNRHKLPNGLKGICDKINALGMDFGIWVEPEMVNTDSRLYREHPDWAVDIPGQAHSEGRNQRMLDLCNPKVQDYIIESMMRVFSSANIAYVKWDMNRIFSDYYSKYLKDIGRPQGEMAHRYVMGLKRIMKCLTEKFPKILFEGCAAGGNRFDLGILCYFPQIWASDNTDAVCRTAIQEGLSYGYPMSTVSAHVSACPNHQTLRVTPLATRFNVAAFGVCGYECNLAEMKKEDVSEIKEQISVYKKWRHTMQFGTFYRQRTGNIHQWTVVSPDKSRAVGLVMQELVQPNTQSESYNAEGLLENALYHVYNRNLRYNVKEFGDLINTAAPVHIRQGSILHNVVAKFVTMPGELEDYELYGDALMNAGIRLKQAFSATGFSDEVRHFPDFASRLYFIEKRQ